MIRILAAFLASVVCTVALPQSFPERPLKMIIPFPPGGGFDGIARPFAEKLATVLGQPIVLEHRPGAGGNLGAEAAAQAAPDGYTLLFANEFLSTNPSYHKAVYYDALRDFVPITKVGVVPAAIAVHPSVPAKDLRALAALSKNKTLNFGTPGIGTGPHLFGAMLTVNGVMQLEHVPYKGSSAAIVDAISGQIPMVLTTLPALAPHIRAGRLHGICVLSGERAAVMPELPTLAESGVPGVTYEVWYGLFAPTGVPEPVLRRVRASAVEALRQPDLIARLRAAGYEAASSTPEALTAQLKQDLEKWRRVVTAARIPKE